MPWFNRLFSQIVGDWDSKCIHLVYDWSLHFLDLIWELSIRLRFFLYQTLNWCLSTNNNSRLRSGLWPSSSHLLDNKMPIQLRLNFLLLDFANHNGIINLWNINWMICRKNNTPIRVVLEMKYFRAVGTINVMMRSFRNWISLTRNLSHIDTVSKVNPVMVLNSLGEVFGQEIDKLSLFSKLRSRISCLNDFCKLSISILRYFYRVSNDLPWLS